MNIYKPLKHGCVLVSFDSTDFRWVNDMLHETGFVTHESDNSQRKIICKENRVWIFFSHQFLTDWCVFLLIWTMFPSPPGHLFTKRTDVLPQDLAKSRSREIRIWTFPIALKFDRHLGSTAAEACQIPERYNHYNIQSHDDVIKWKHFPRNWPFVRGIHRSPVNSPHKGQWRGALMFSLICVWTNDWVNNREAGDLRRYRAHSDVIVMSLLRDVRPLSE